ncbi:hypothetical protein Tco_0420830 [Tanacetum coccineum]
MKIRAGIQVSRPGELKRQLQLWKCFGRLYSIVFVLVRNIVKLSAEQAFWLRISNPTIESSNIPRVKVEVPSELPKSEWGLEHTKAVFNKEIITFLKSLKYIFNVFDKDLLNEIMDVQTVFDQMDAAVHQSSVDKQCLEIAKKELLLKND